MPSPASTRSLSLAILRHAAPVLVAQLASMSTTVVDTIIAGRVGTLDLAAVAIGSGIYISVMLAFAGVVQGLTPVAAQQVGAGRRDELPRTFQNGIWVALALGLLGAILLSFPGWMLHVNRMDPAVEARTRDYLAVLACAIPGTLLFRTCGAMLNALGKPRMLMFFGLGGAASHAMIAPALAFGWFGLPALGIVGSAAANAINTTVFSGLALAYLARSQVSRHLNLLHGWRLPERPAQKEIWRLGLPIGMSAFVEITSFGLIALLVAPLGALAAGGQRVLGSLAGVCYMLPLSLSIATLALVGHAAGAQDIHRVRSTIRAGLLLGAGSSLLIGIALWLLADPIIRAYTPDAGVQALSLSLIGLIASFQLFDAVQTVAAQALRGLKMAKGPMVIHMLCFWGIGLLGGWWLCYRGWQDAGLPALGLAGFWWAATLATVTAALLFWLLLRLAIRRWAERYPASPPASDAPAPVTSP